MVPPSMNSKEKLRKSLTENVAAIREDKRQVFFSLHDAFEDENNPRAGPCPHERAALRIWCLERAAYSSSHRASIMPLHRRPLVR